MDWRSLPPLSALRAFAAFAEAGNVVGAGEALGVSHAAISQQLRSLETHLDVALLDRSGRALSLTPEGVQLAAALQTGFGGIIDTLRQIVGMQDERPLHISTTPTFAASWLMPRLPRFRDLHPQVDLMLNPTPAIVDLVPDGIDVAIRYGAGQWPGLEATVLLVSPLVVVGAPSLIGEGPMPGIADLAEFPWLEENCTSEADRWLMQHGVKRGLKRGLTQVPGNLLMDGARDGQGIAVVVRAFVERDIASGRLRALQTEETSDMGYYIVTRPGVMRPMLKDFVTWLRRERSADEGIGQ